MYIDCRTLYISDWGDKPGIFSMKTDGSQFSLLVNTTIAWPNGLALDYPGQRLYLVDAKYKIVESIKLDGTGREVITQLPLVSHPFSIDVFENLMMWSDWDKYQIHFTNRFTGEVVKSISVSDFSLSGIKIAQAALQPSGKLAHSVLGVLAKNKAPVWSCETAAFHRSVLPRTLGLTLCLLRYDYGSVLEETNFSTHKQMIF